MKAIASLLSGFVVLLSAVIPGILAFRPVVVPQGRRTSPTSLRTPSAGASPFFPVSPSYQPLLPARQSPLFRCSSCDFSNNDDEEKLSWRQRILRRSGHVAKRVANPLSFAPPIIEYEDDSSSSSSNQILLAGGVGATLKGVWGRVKKLHDPKFYMAVQILAGIRWSWLFRSIFYWFALGFLIKWYRARYVFKIPVWDRQPNWNNVITNKEQEKDLRAMTCKNCGSTLFIAKTREFFFEGSTGIGGLGCFTCGAKGKDNFIEDRDRIVEDVADMDDYFEYERPLDLVSAYERRKVLKEAKGDEEKANQILAERNEAGTSDTVDADTAESATSEAPDTTDDVEAATTDAESNDEPPPPEEDEPESDPEPEEPQQPHAEAPKKKESPPPSPPSPQAPTSAPLPSLRRSGKDYGQPKSDSPSSSSSSSDLDLLGMDDF